MESYNIEEIVGEAKSRYSEKLKLVNLDSIRFLEMDSYCSLHQEETEHHPEIITLL